MITETQLHQYDTELKEIFETISYSKNQELFFNDLYDVYEIQSRIRVAFSVKRELQTDSEIIPKQAQLLISGHLSEVEKNNKLYPNEKDIAQILKLDLSNESIEVDFMRMEQAYTLMKETMKPREWATLCLIMKPLKPPKTILCL